MTLIISFVMVFVIIAIIGLVSSPPRRAKKTHLEPGTPSSTATIDDLSGEQIDEIEEALQTAPAEKPTFHNRLGRARGMFGEYFAGIRGRDKINDATWDDLEEALIRADVGVATTTSLLDDLRSRVKSESIANPDQLLEALKADLKKAMSTANRGLHLEDEGPNVWLFVGVNGVGKTTSIGKVANRYGKEGQGKSLVLAAGDTFRAAASEQLGVWAERAGAEIVRGQQDGDPGSVIFDAVEKANARKADLVLADTAGRLHTKFNLMEELKKIKRISERPPAKLTEVLLVLDATTGQNGLVQAKQFSDAVDITGVVLTKLDGTAKGGIALAIEKELGVPIKLVGLGETAVDLVDFDSDDYVEALFN